MICCCFPFFPRGPCSGFHLSLRECFTTFNNKYMGIVNTPGFLKAPPEIWTYGTVIQGDAWGKKSKDLLQMGMNPIVRTFHGKKHYRFFQQFQFTMWRSNSASFLAFRENPSCFSRMPGRVCQTCFQARNWRWLYKKSHPSCPLLCLEFRTTSKQRTKLTNAQFEQRSYEKSEFLSASCPSGQRLHTLIIHKFFSASLSCQNKGVSKNRATPKWMVYNGKPY